MNAAGRSATRALEWARYIRAAIGRDRTFGLAAETAFWVSLALIPLAAVAGLVAARLSTGNWNELSPVLSPLPGAARDLIASQLVKVSRWNGGAVGVTSAVVFVWLGSSGVHAIFEALEVETGVSRPWWKKRLLALATCVALSLAVAALALLSSGLGDSFARLVGDLRVPSILRAAPTAFGRLLRLAASFVVEMGYVTGLYWVGVPQDAGCKRPILPGAIVAVLLQATLRVGYSTYISKVGTGDAYTAGLAIVGLTLTALYLLVVALLIGALVNRKLGRPTARSQRATPATSLGGAPRSRSRITGELD